MKAIIKNGVVNNATKLKVPYIIDNMLIQNR